MLHMLQLLKTIVEYFYKNKNKDIVLGENVSKYPCLKYGLMNNLWNASCTLQTGWYELIETTNLGPP